MTQPATIHPLRLLRFENWSRSTCGLPSSFETQQFFSLILGQKLLRTSPGHTIGLHMNQPWATSEILLHHAVKNEPSVSRSTSITLPIFSNKLRNRRATLLDPTQAFRCPPPNRRPEYHVLSSTFPIESSADPKNSKRQLQGPTPKEAATLPLPVPCRYDRASAAQTSSPFVTPLAESRRVSSNRSETKVALRRWSPTLCDLQITAAAVKTMKLGYHKKWMLFVIK